MGLPKKGSRTILVDTIKYRWIVGPNNKYHVFRAEKEGTNGRRVEVYFESDANLFWVEFPEVADLNLKIIKPRDVENILRQALQLGWNPNEKGSPIVYYLINSKVTKGENHL